MRTPQQAIKDAMPAILAFAEGKPVEVRYYSGTWSEFDQTIPPAFSSVEHSWRPKPEPKPPTYRPWTIDEVPLGAVARKKANINKAIISATDSDHCVLLSGSTWKSLGDIFAHYVLINADGTESPCGVEVPHE